MIKKDILDINLVLDIFSTFVVEMHFVECLIYSESVNSSASSKVYLLHQLMTDAFLNYISLFQRLPAVIAGAFLA